MKRLKITFNSPAILGFTLICLASLLLGWITGDVSTQLLFSVYRAPLSNPFTWFRFIGHIFGHSGWEHFISNIMLILIVGPLLEEKYGTKDMVTVIAVTAFVTGLVHFILFPSTMLLGASGIAFALILLSSITSVREGEIPMTFILVAVIYVGREIWTGIFVSDNISNLTHIIGGIVGAASGYIMARKD